VLPSLIAVSEPSEPRGAISGGRKVFSSTTRADHLREVDQRPLAALLRREMIVGSRATGVRLTKKGAEAIERYESKEMPTRMAGRHGYAPIAPSVETLLRSFTLRVVPGRERSGRVATAVA
jgi:hypothetical protein